MSALPPYNAGDEAAVTKRQKREREAENRLAAGLAYVLAERPGRDLLWWLLGETGVYAGSYTGDNRTFFNEGRRDVGLRLLDRLLAADPETYLTMIKENRNERETADQ